MNKNDLFKLININFKPINILKELENVIYFYNIKDTFAIIRNEIFYNLVKIDIINYEIVRYEISDTPFTLCDLCKYFVNNRMDYNIRNLKIKGSLYNKEPKLSKLIKWEE